MRPYKENECIWKLFLLADPDLVDSGIFCNFAGVNVRTHEPSVPKERKFLKFLILIFMRKEVVDD